MHALLVPALALAASVPAQEVGQVFPDRPYPELATGKLARLADWRGKKVLLMQFASW